VIAALVGDYPENFAKELARPGRLACAISQTLRRRQRAR
jgi:hypothetical protein